MYSTSGLLVWSLQAFIVIFLTCLRHRDLWLRALGKDRNSSSTGVHPEVLGLCQGVVCKSPSLFPLSINTTLFSQPGEFLKVHHVHFWKHNPEKALPPKSWKHVKRRKEKMEKERENVNEHSRKHFTLNSKTYLKEIENRKYCSSLVIMKIIYGEHETEI